MIFSRVTTKRSASPFSLGQYGVILLCLNPRLLAKSSNSCLLKGGPLLLFKIYGTLCLANMASSLGITALADVDRPGEKKVCG